MKLPNGAGRIETWAKGVGWTAAPAGSITPDELMHGACRPASARDAARLAMPVSEI
jgi:hypothetical protein